MNRHVKLAIIIAPFLAIGGYIASDYYMANKPQEEQLLKLNLGGSCDMVQIPCTLTAEGLSMQMSDENGNTRVRSSYPMDRISVSFVDSEGQETVHHLAPSEDRKLWQTPTNFSQLRAVSDRSITVRISAAAEIYTYLHEFQAGL